MSNQVSKDQAADSYAVFNDCYIIPQVFIDKFDDLSNKIKTLSEGANVQSETDFGYLGTEKAAAFLDISVTLLREMDANNKLERYKINSKVVYKIEDLQNLPIKG